MIVANNKMAIEILITDEIIITHQGGQITFSWQYVLPGIAFHGVLDS